MQTRSYQETLRAADQERKKTQDPAHDVVHEGLGATDEEAGGGKTVVAVEEVV